MDEKFNYKLLVEGNTDFHIMMSLCVSYKIAENFDIINCHGKENLLSQLKMRLTNPSVNQVIGAVVDADSDCASSYQKVKEILKTYSFGLPEVLPREGLVITSSNDNEPRIGVWIMPDNISSGMVEDFALSLVEPTDVLMQKAESIIVEIEKEGIGRYKKGHRSKAKIHTYLAWNDEPGMPIGQAVTKKVLNSNIESAQEFLNWVKRVFTNNSSFLQ